MKIATGESMPQVGGPDDDDGGEDEDDLQATRLWQAPHFRDLDTAPGVWGHDPLTHDPLKSQP